MTFTIRGTAMRNHPSVRGALPFSAIAPLAASIAHEVDQPLAAIALNAQAALRAIGRAPAQAEAALHNVLEASRLASEILRSMRTLAGQAHAARACCELAEAVDTVLAQYQAQLAQLAVVPQIVLSSAAATIWASPVQLHQLLRNLVGNALDALALVAPGQRCLRIGARVDGAGQLVLSVQDNGPGMDVEQARCAFEPMVGNKPHGLGLGLAICRAIVDAHGGHIRAESAPARGCTVEVALPGGAARDAWHG
jgi:C4-dicarboxylate-specific signal transduction histidine kinase